MSFSKKSLKLYYSYSLSLIGESRNRLQFQSYVYRLGMKNKLEPKSFSHGNLLSLATSFHFNLYSKLTHIKGKEGSISN